MHTHDSYRNLSRSNNLVLLHPDKGNGIVILEKPTYIFKVELHLSDACKLKKLDVDMLELFIKCEGQLIHFLWDTLVKKQSISETVYYELCPRVSKPGILYGLPKVHKAGCLSRPVMSAIGTCNYSLAKFLVPILQPHTSNQYTVHSSFSFVKEIIGYTPSANTVMVSFDVASLFTNIPLDDTVHISLDGLFMEADTINLSNCSFNRSQFKKLGFAVKGNHFIFNSKLCRQQDGVAISSQLEPSFANIFMCALEQNFLSNCPLDCKPLLYCR